MFLLLRWIGQLPQIYDSQKGHTKYQYDPVGRLLTAQTPNTQELFAFDPAGNRLNEGTHHKANNNLRALSPVLGNLLKEYAGIHYQYDVRGNLIEKSQNGQITHYHWDDFNRLAQLENQKGLTRYYYDALGRRIAKEHNKRRTVYDWDGDVMALEQTGVDKTHYIFEPGGFEPVAQFKEPHDLYFYHLDHLGTPIALTDKKGEVAWEADYKAWGEAKEVITQAALNAGLSNPIRFQGQYYDEESGLHYIM